MTLFSVETVQSILGKKIGLDYREHGTPKYTVGTVASATVEGKGENRELSITLDSGSFLWFREYNGDQDRLNHIDFIDEFGNKLNTRTIMSEEKITRFDASKIITQGVGSVTSTKEKTPPEEEELSESDIRLNGREAPKDETGLWFTGEGDSGVTVNLTINTEDFKKAVRRTVENLKWNLK